MGRYAPAPPLGTALALLAACACSTTAPPADARKPIAGTAAPAARGTSDQAFQALADGLPATDYFIATGTGSSAESARAQAAETMDELLWGAGGHWPEGGSAMSLATGRPLFADETVREAQDGDRYLALIAFDRREWLARARAWSDQGEERLNAVPDPSDGWRGLIEYYADLLWHAATLATLCDRMTAWGAPEPCRAPEVRDHEQALREATEALVLEPKLARGIPLRDGRPIRSVEVIATASAGDETTPIAELPVRLENTSDHFQNAEATTGDDGVASFAVSESSSGEFPSVVVEVDRHAFLGDFETLMAPRTITVHFLPHRPMPTGVALAIEATEAHSDGGLQAFSAALARAMSSQGELEADLLDPDSTLRASKDLPGLLSHLERASKGSYDLVIVGEAGSQLTSRMGSRSVWHEARARLTIYDAWTGRQLGTVSHSAQALGMGETRAAENAFEKLAREIAGKLSGALGTPVATRLPPE